MAQSGTGASKITIEEEAPSVRQIAGVPTAISGVVGVTERGPVGIATLLTSYEEYKKTFGGDVADGDVTHAARGFFLEGGQQLYVVRTVHYSDIDDGTSKTSAAATIQINTAATAASAATVLGTNAAPFDLEPSDTLVITVDAGSPTTATFSATAAARESGAETFALVNNQTLTVQVDGGSTQTITFVTGNFVSIGAATAAEVAAVVNAQIVGAHATVTSGGTKVTITSDKRGTGSHINVTGGSANGALGFTTGIINGTGNVANIDAVTFSEVKTVVEAAVSGLTVTDGGGGTVRISSNTTGTSSHILVGASSSADDELGLDNATHTGSDGSAQPTLQFDAEDGGYGNDLSLKVAAATSGEAARFDLTILRSGSQVGAVLRNLTMDSSDARYVATVLNDADTGHPQGLTVTDLGLTGTATQRRPGNGTSAAMSGGDDGLTSLADTDFVGSQAGGTALYAFDLVEQIRLIAVPGRATSTVQNGVIAYTEVHREGSCVGIFDPPADQSASEIVTYVTSTAALFEASEFAAIYWPRVLVSNPDTSVFGSDASIVVPPSGHVMGRINLLHAATGGVYKSPAGLEQGNLVSILGFETDEVKDVRKRDLVYPYRINPIGPSQSGVRIIDGGRTLKSTGNFPNLSERLGVIFIEQSIKVGLDFARHQNNDDTLRGEVYRTVRLFLVTQMRVGAFRSKNPKTAFFVDVGKGLNTDAVVFAGQLKGRVGLATQKPAEFISFAFSQDTRALEAEAAS
jgi:phage tail sheath protein FI